jgi:hypothetical protein
MSFRDKIEVWEKWCRADEGRHHPRTPLKFAIQGWALFLQIIDRWREESAQNTALLNELLSLYQHPPRTVCKCSEEEEQVANEARPAAGPWQEGPPPTDGRRILGYWAYYPIGEGPYAVIRWRKGRKSFGDRHGKDVLPPSWWAEIYYPSTD